MSAQHKMPSSPAAERMYQRYEAIDGHDLRKGISAGLAWLRTHQQVVNALNVFPVPDGDTGTNMLLTMQAAWKEVEAQDNPNIGFVAHAVAHGALMGARGNSGVILSQLWRGFARQLDGVGEMGAELLVKSLDEARRTAYKGVVRPVEGTILTVSKDIAEAAQIGFDEGVRNPLDLLRLVVEAAHASVARTPDLLPVLKDAGVVDSGGKGLAYILEGMLRSAYRLPLDEPIQAVQPLSSLSLDGAAEAVEPGQDWEVVVDFRPSQPLDLEAFYGQLEALGTSIQVGEGDGMYRMHIHVPDDTQYRPIEYLQGLGIVTKVAIENLMDQIEGQGDRTGQELHLENVKQGEIAVVAVAPGPGIARVFASLGAAAIVEGGQTMNPSTQEILAAFEDLPTDKVLILPNNKNIHLAASQAKELTVKHVEVVPTVAVPQGVAAMVALDRSGELAEVASAMTKAIEDVSFGELTIATRSVEIDGVSVTEGQVIGLLNGKLVVAGDELESSLVELLENADVEQHELLALYVGQNLPLAEANAIADRLRQRWPHLETEVLEGGQPHYHFILSLE
ncbi:MAG TPA: DAK2 domain-containing protein [Anaerolineales bacterium]|jgi:hypothetical protein